MRKYSRVLLILLGLEITVLNIIYAGRESLRVRTSIGSIFLIVLILAVFIV